MNTTAADRKSKFAPGPKGHFLMGSIKQFVADPLAFMVRVALRYGNVARFRFATKYLHLASSPDAVREVLVTKGASFQKADLDIKVMGKFLGRGLITSNGDFHRRQRRLAQPAFHPRRVESYAQVMVKYTEEMMDSWGQGGQRDLMDEMTRLTMFIAARTLFSADVTATAEVAGQAIHELQSIAEIDYRRPFQLPVWLPTAHNRRMKKARSAFYGIVESIIAERRSEGEDKDHGDLLSMLLLARDEEDGSRMSDEQVRDEVTTLFAAGHETTSNALVWTFHLLARHPEAREKLHAELDAVLGGRSPSLEDLPKLPYTEMVLKESMRIYPPVWVLNARQALENTEIGGFKIRKGEYVFVSPYSQHRLPRHFPKPEHFDPERFSPEREKELPRYAYIPFGAGQRVCIGNIFAMMEARLILAAVCSRYTLDSVNQEPPELMPRITLSPRGGLPMHVKARQTIRV